MTVTVAGGSFDLPRPAVKKKVAKDTTKRDRWLRYGAGASIVGILAADALVLNGMLRHTAANILLDPPAAETAAASATAAPAGEGFSAMNVPADRGLSASGRTFSKWTSSNRTSTANAAENGSLLLGSSPALTSAPTGALPPVGLPGQGGPTGGGSNSDTNDGDANPPAPAPQALVQQVVQDVADAVRANVPMIGEDVATAMEAVATELPTDSGPAAAPEPEPAIAPEPIEAVVEPVIAATDSIGGDGLL